MAEADKPSIIGVPIEGWRHAFAVLSGMPGLIGAGMVVLFIINLATLPLLPDVRADPPVPPTIGMQIGSFLLGIVSGFLLTPVAIAVHRFVLLGEFTPRYWPDPRDPRFMRFFLFTVVFQLLVGVPATLMSITAAGGTGPAIVLALVFFAILVVAIIASLRLLILFPAIAVDAGGAQWRNAMADTKGYTWRVFFIVIVTIIPSFIVTAPLYWLLPPGGPDFTRGVIFSLIQAIVGVLTLAAGAAAASKLFAALANKLNG